METDTGADDSAGFGQELRAALAKWHPAVGDAHLAGRRVPGRVSLQLNVEAASARRAVETAVREVTAALRDLSRPVHIARIEVVAEDEFEAEMRSMPVELMGVREIAEAAGVTRQRADQLTHREDFPQPLASLAAGKIWSGAAVRRWLATWERKSGRPRASSS
ncbi:hypothetical protein ACFFOQ_27390 [Planobispora takensis]